MATRFNLCLLDVSEVLAGAAGTAVAGIAGPVVADAAAMLESARSGEIDMAIDADGAGTEAEEGGCVAEE